MNEQIPSAAGREEPEHETAQHARQLLRFLSKRKNLLSPLLVLTHDYPDPDALAAAFALDYLAGQCFGIECKIAYGGVIGRTENRAMVRILRIPVHKLKPSDLKKYRNVALVDTQPHFENNPYPNNRRAAIVVDQHPSIVKPAASLAIIDPGAGATCVIVAQALLQHGVQIPMRVATALAYGVLSDTLDLYRAHRPDVVQTYISILPRCDMKILARIQNPTRSRRFFLTLGRAIRGAVMNRGLVVAHLGFIENPDLVSQMAEFLLTYEHARWSACTGRYRGKLCVSLRASQLQSQAGTVLREVFANPKEAGGHGAIGGGRFRVGRDPREEDWLRAEQELQYRLFKRLRRTTKGPFQKPFLRD